MNAVAAVATALALRDRGTSVGAGASSSAVLLASSLVISFGGAALRRQRKQLLLERDLALADDRERGQRAARASQARGDDGDVRNGNRARGLHASGPSLSGGPNKSLARASDDERAAHAARVILTQTDRIQTLIRSFLDLARGDSPVLSLVDPALVASEAITLVSHRFGKAGVGTSGRRSNPGFRPSNVIARSWSMRSSTSS